MARKLALEEETEGEEEYHGLTLGSLPEFPAELSGNHIILYAA